MASTAVTDSDLTDYVHDVGVRIAQGAKLAAPGKVNEAFIANVRCQLVNCRVINAFSTGGTHVYVTNGLLQHCRTEEELATAIAHAYAHLINRDLETTQMKPNPAEKVTMLAWDFVVNRYTREQERQADALAKDILAHAGYNPAHFSDLFDHMEVFTGGRLAPDRDPLPARAAVMSTYAAVVPNVVSKLPVADPKSFIALCDRSAHIQEPQALTVPRIILLAIPNCILSADTKEQQEAQGLLKPVAPPPQHPLEPS